MARPPRRPSETNLGTATPPAAVPDPAPAVSPAPPLAVLAAPAVPLPPVAEVENTGDPDEQTDTSPAPRRRRKPGKHTLYADAGLIFKLQDRTMAWQRRYLRRYGKIPAGVIEDAFLAVAFAHLDEVEAELRRALES